MTSVALGLPTVRGAEPAMLPRPDNPALIDTYGRVATDLRVSLTDRCNLRCTYCMPETGMTWLPREDLLSTGELIRLVRLAVRDLGVTQVRFSGGEPLLRPDLEALIGGVAALCTPAGNPVQTALTTNGVGLVERAAGLAAAGLGRINVSLDTLDAETYRTITRRDRLPQVLAGIEAAVAAGLSPVKINAVLLRGVNDHEAAALTRWALGQGLRLRFIEQMPLEAHDAWARQDMVTAQEILTALQGELDLQPTPGSQRGSSPAENWLVRDDRGEPMGQVGIIASITRPFCGACDRTRLTADGQVRNCLFAHQETDLRHALRHEASDEDIAELWRKAMWGKAAGHGVNDPAYIKPQRPMSAIGG